MDRSTGDSGMESEDEVFPDPRRCTSLPANQRRKRAQRVQLLSADQKLASGSSKAEIKHTLPRLKENSCNCGRQVVHYNVEHLHLDVSREPLGIKIAQVVDFKYQPVLHMNGSGKFIILQVPPPPHRYPLAPTHTHCYLKFQVKGDSVL